MIDDTSVTYVRRHARRRPDALAVADPSGELSWRELADAVELRAGALTVPPGSVVGLHAVNDRFWVVDFLALRARGHEVVSLPWSLPMRAAKALAQSFDAIALVGGETFSTLRRPDVRAAGSALVHLTSGTTGLASGVPREVDNLDDEAEAVAVALDLSADRVILLSTPVAHSFASGLLLAALRRGTPSVLLPSFDIGAALVLVRRYRPVLFTGTPYVFRMLAGAAAVRREGLPDLAVPLCGGAPLHESWAAQWLDVVGVPICQEYGLSEGGIATVNLESAFSHPGSVGRPLPGVRIVVVDAADVPVPAGAPGHVVIDRLHQPTAYVGPGGTRHTIPTARYGGRVLGLHTGDLGLLNSEGLLHLVGRTKAMINVGGAKVSPAEVEQHLLDHGSVRDAVVVPFTDHARGEAVGALVEVDDTLVTVPELAAHLRERLSDYALPRRWQLCTSIPRTASGKPDRGHARSILEERAS